MRVVIDLEHIGDGYALMTGRLLIEEQAMRLADFGLQILSVLGS